MNEVYVVIFTLPCLFVVIYVIYATRQKTLNRAIAEKLEDRLIKFNPEPLVDTSGIDLSTLEIPEIDSNDDESIDFTKANYLNLLNDDTIKKAAEDCIRKYGVGNCGPRSFYGTSDVHVQLEEELAKYLHVQETLVYAYGFTTISSSIAAFCRPDSIIFCDENINFAIQQGVHACKSQILFFPHNDHNVLKELAESHKKSNKRKYLILEDIYFNTGKLCPLPKFLEIAKQFKLRVVLEVSISLGTIGKTGGGILEYFKIETYEVDLIIGTLEGALGSIGGFCGGTTNIMDYQRLTSLGYGYSASLPTYLCQVALTALPMISDRSKYVQKLARRLHSSLKKIDNYIILSDTISPLKIFTTGTREQNKIVHEYCSENNVHIINRGETLALNLNAELFFNKIKLARALDVLKQASLQK